MCAGSQLVNVFVYVGENNSGGFRSALPGSQNATEIALKEPDEALLELADEFIQRYVPPCKRLEDYVVGRFPFVWEWKARGIDHVNHCSDAFQTVCRTRGRSLETCRTISRLVGHGLVITHTLITFDPQ